MDIIAGHDMYAKLVSMIPNEEMNSRDAIKLVCDMFECMPNCLYSVKKKGCSRCFIALCKTHKNADKNQILCITTKFIPGLYVKTFHELAAGLAYFIYLQENDIPELDKSTYIEKLPEITVR